MKLRREAVALVRDAGTVIGVKVTDEDLRRSLDLDPDDVITAISGRTIERELDVFDITYNLKRMRASTVYVDLVRDRRPVLLRWKIDGDLQTARVTRPYDLGGSLGSLRGGLGGIPYAISAPDPLVDTIKRIDDLNYIVPRTTVERVFASTSSYAGVARTWPSRRTGGFQVFGVRPGTIVSAIGIANGDSIRAINGHVVRTIDEAVELYQQIKDEREWRIDLERRGRPALITITIN
jgi:general secretion pathway protein C